jgi:ubiquinone/menaquinone biosynthesis C-methylase UbiE
MRNNIRISTPGYWPLPKFAKINFGGKWLALKPLKLGEKEAEYSIAAAKSPSFVTLESSITKALPKKLIMRSGKKRISLSRWIGGIYSNISPRSLSQLRLFYDSIAPIYKFHVEPERKHQLAAFLEFIPLHAKTLDASAGDCTLAIAAGKGYDFTCADISEGMLSLAGNKMKKSKKIVASASKLPFQNSSFDCVVHTFSNIHSLDRNKFFREFHRVLTPGGVLLYHPVKSPGEQWPKNFVEKTMAALHSAGFADARRVSTESKGKKKTTLVFYLARKARL